MADENKLNSAITEAISVLKNSFGQEVDVENRKEFKYFNENSLVEMYLTELEEKNLSLFFSDIPASIARMRSSYLPIDLVRQISTGFEEILSETISDSSAIKESNENAFMRMLGMPQSNSIDFATLEIVGINSEGERFLYSYEEVEKEILNQRQAPKSDRKVLVTYDVYNFDNEKIESIDDGLLAANDEQIQNESADFKKLNLANLEDEFFAYSYLLIPPIQDSRISGCINEASKIVPPNFSNRQSRKINSNSLKSSLLESIIRLRRDQLSGYSNNPTIFNEFGEEIQLTSDNYGVLESLFILRIRCALKALAIKMSKDIDFLREVFEQTGLVPTDQESQSESTHEDPRISPATKEKESGAGEMAVKGFSDLEKQKIIEDSIMALLDDTHEALDLQSQTQRNSAIRDSHIMSGLLGVIDLPRERIKVELLKEQQDRRRQVDGVGDKNREFIDATLGISKGVGIVDILVFVLALFTIPEDYLIGLLSDVEYQRYLEEFYQNSDGPIKVQTSESINVLSEYILDGYSLFKRDLNNDDSGFGG